MLSLLEIKAIASEVISNRDKDRGYMVDVAGAGPGAKISISYISAIKYDKEPDPQISKDPEVTVLTYSELVPLSVSTSLLTAFVSAMLEEIEEVPINYE